MSSLYRDPDPEISTIWLLGGLIWSTFIGACWWFGEEAAAVSWLLLATLMTGGVLLGIYYLPANRRPGPAEIRNMAMGAIGFTALLLSALVVWTGFLGMLLLIRRHPFPGGWTRVAMELLQSLCVTLIAMLTPRFQQRLITVFTAVALKLRRR